MPAANTARLLRKTFAVSVNGITRREVMVGSVRGLGDIVEKVEDVATMRGYVVLTPTGERARLALLAL